MVTNFCTNMSYSSLLSWYVQVDIDVVDPDDVFSLHAVNDGGQTVRSADGQ